MEKPKHSTFLTSANVTLAVQAKTQQSDLRHIDNVVNYSNCLDEFLENMGSLLRISKNCCLCLKTMHAADTFCMGLINLKHEQECLDTKARLVHSMGVVFSGSNQPVRLALWAQCTLPTVCTAWSH